MNRFTESFWKKTWDLIWRDCETIYPIAGECRMNFKCHVNAFHEAIINDHDFVVACWYQMPDSQSPSIHFVNYDGESYIDNTIGYLAEKTSYFLIRKIPREEFEKELPWSYLQRIKDCYQNNASFLERIFADLSM